MKKLLLLTFISLSFLAVILVSCTSDFKKTDNSGDVIIHALSDPDNLNPQTYQSADAGYLLNIIFQSLVNVDYKSLELVPVLCESRPEIKPGPEGGLLITYNVRPEAEWDNGKPITARDIVFSLKVIKNPRVNNERIRPYYEFIDDVLLYPDDSLKLTIVYKEQYVLAEASSGDFPIMPEYVYDPRGLMKDFTIRQLNTVDSALLNNQKINEFANDFNGEKFQREKGFVVGSGAYELAEWSTGQKIVLQRKKNWWGEKVTKNRNVFFDANPPKITYQVINDQTTALVALKAGNIDVMHSIKSKDFVELPKSEKIVNNFNIHTPPMYAYTYIGINTRLPKFSDKKVRQALACLVDADKIITTIFYGLVTRVPGPIHPSRVKYFNSDIKPYSYDPEKAKNILTEAGWKDSNGNGILDKMVDGQLQEMIIEFAYNSGNDERKAVALLFQEEARKAGIKVNVTQQEWAKYLENQKNHQFEMYYGSWIGTPLPNDHKQIYHSSSYDGGSNYVGLSNPAIDALIDSMRVELSDDRQAEMSKRFQELLHEEASYIFLFAPKERIAIHKRFTNALVSPMRPGYWEPSFAVSEKN